MCVWIVVSWAKTTFSWTSVTCMNGTRASTFLREALAFLRATLGVSLQHKWTWLRPSPASQASPMTRTDLTGDRLFRCSFLKGRPHLSFHQLHASIWSKSFAPWLMARERHSLQSHTWINGETVCLSSTLGVPCDMRRFGVHEIVSSLHFLLDVQVLLCRAEQQVCGRVCTLVSRSGISCHGFQLC